jgi:hypothetical protein
VASVHDANSRPSKEQDYELLNTEMKHKQNTKSLSIIAIGTLIFFGNAQ